MKMSMVELKDLRSQIIGGDSTFETPFGERLLTYCDYTASGRCLGFIENYLHKLQKIYANTHTEDDVTGRNMTQLLHDAEQIIKACVNAGPDGRIISVGTGSTGAIWKFQQIVGVALPPATRQLLFSLYRELEGEESLRKMLAFLEKNQPVVFVGPYEHHSNEISWREGLSTVLEVKMSEDGTIDLEHLESLLQNPEYSNRLRIGSFSAASNVTGIISPVHEIARLLHQYDALACFDYAASAPYVKIDMNPGSDPLNALDAIFISPHKFIGGPGSNGILVFNKKVYDTELSPTMGAGGTVDYVSPDGHVFIENIEEREKPGTPGVLQTLKTALVFQLKDAIGVKKIEKREQELLQKVFEKWMANDQIEILGNLDLSKRIAIISFNVRGPRGNYLHPKFVTRLLNDLFGIQSRAGCSCAGPYGHRLLNIDQQTSLQYRDCIQKGFQGIKPGWCRLGFHFVMDDTEADFVIDAVEFIADKGYCFLSLYDFDLQSGQWVHKQERDLTDHFSLTAALESKSSESSSLDENIRRAVYQSYLQQAESLAADLSKTPLEQHTLEGEIGELQFFSLPQGSYSS
ncbi:MAG: aminotransferase class V-fold PLP-dependent enzyme [SAR324 cluster bacterium]|nr:aminotransferase class V-fold PLP-dependent enzyme [SAR324 cluster bacterium]